MTEEQMLSMITRVSGKYSVKLSAQQTQSLIEGIKVKAAQQGASYDSAWPFLAQLPSHLLESS